MSSRRPPSYLRTTIHRTTIHTMSRPVPPDSDRLDGLDDTARGPSKSARKRDALAVRSLVETLAALSVEQRARLELTEDLRDALALLDRTGARGARKRQVGFIAKRLRRQDTTELEAALETLQQGARGELRAHHLAERWRDRLIGSADPDALLAPLIRDYPSLDRQRARHWIRAAREAAQNTAVPRNAPRAKRELYRLIREAEATPSMNAPGAASVTDEPDP